MDTEKWKSVLVPKEVYEEIKRTSSDRGRTISGQLKIVWQIYNKLKEKLSVWSLYNREYVVGFILGFVIGAILL